MTEERPDSRKNAKEILDELFKNEELFELTYNED